jgi:hypothetical protein
MNDGKLATKVLLAGDLAHRGRGEHAGAGGKGTGAGVGAARIAADHAGAQRNRLVERVRTKS